jgi:transcriptional regulator with XRE-family HTH domain
MPTSQAKKLGALVRKARLNKGLSVRGLAETLGINYSTISYLESGQIERPAAKTLQRLSRALEIPLEDLYALAGYARKEGLPEFPVYLRSKYGLTAAEAAELEEHFSRLRGRKKGGRK